MTDGTSSTASSIQQLAKEAMNFQYAVFIAVVVGLSFAFERDPDPGGIHLTVAEGRRLCYALFVGYYFLDWLTANLRNFVEIKSIPQLVSRLFWVAYLGVVILYMNSAGSTRFVLLALYALVSGLNDVIEHQTLDCNTPRSALALLVGTIRACVAIPLLAPAVAAAGNRPDALVEWDDRLPAYIAVYFGLKLARIWLLSTSSPALAEQHP